MELHQIRYFLAAAGTLNFTRAAEHCAVTKPTLTRAIKKLEQDLGVCVIPESSIALDGLACRPVTEPEIERPVELVTVAGRRHSPALAAFLEAGQRHAWPEPVVAGRA